MIKERVVPHFQHPKGVFGWVAGRIMASQTTNVERNLWVAEVLAPVPDAQVLEIGHGPGLGIAQLWPTLTTGHIVGVEMSRLMSRTAARRNREGVRADCVEFQIGDSAAPSATFATSTSSTASTPRCSGPIQRRPSPTRVRDSNPEANSSSATYSRPLPTR